LHLAFFFIFIFFDLLETNKKKLKCNSYTFSLNMFLNNIINLYLIFKKKTNYNDEKVIILIIIFL
jgi:hypothetical protein